MFPWSLSQEFPKGPFELDSHDRVAWNICLLINFYKRRRSSSTFTHHLQSHNELLLKSVKPLDLNFLFLKLKLEECFLRSLLPRCWCFYQEGKGLRRNDFFSKRNEGLFSCIHLQDLGLCLYGWSVLGESPSFTEVPRQFDLTFNKNSKILENDRICQDHLFYNHNLLAI